MEYLKVTGVQARLIEPDKNYPIDSFVIFAIEDNKIMGRVAIVVLPHIENLEINEDKNGILAIQLMKEAEDVLKELGRTCAASFIMNDELKVADYAKRIGYKQLPASVWIKPLIEVERQ